MKRLLAYLLLALIPVGAFADEMTTTRDYDRPRAISRDGRITPLVAIDAAVSVSFEILLIAN